MNCKGDSLYDLYLSSKICREKKHAVSKRTSSLKGYGNLCAAVEFINATIKHQVNDLFEAEYHAKNAIKCSIRYKDNLNACIRKLATNLLRDINDSKRNKASPLFTLSELILFSKKDEIVIDKYEKKQKKPKKYKIKKTNKNKKTYKTIVNSIFEKTNEKNIIQVNINNHNKKKRKTYKNEKT